MKLSIIILNHNSGTLLADCLASVFADEIPFPYEVIVPDNASTDDSIDEPMKRWGSRLRVLHNPRNGGFAYGNNIGIRAARGEILCLLNPDTVVRRGAFRALVEFLDAHPTAGFIGPKVLNDDGTLQLSARRSIPTPFDAIARALWLSKLFPTSKTFARYNRTYDDPELVQQVDASTGCCIVARRSMLDAIGLLDEGFFIYCEDVDWFIRARDAGWQTWYVPTAVIEHHHAYSEQFRKFRSVADFHHSMLYLYRKHYAAHYPLPVNALIAWMVRARMVSLMAVKSLKGWK